MTALLQSALPFVLALVCLGAPSAMLAAHLLDQAIGGRDKREDYDV